MKTIDQETAVQRMAQWRATGGATGSTAGGEAFSSGDDGLKAAGPSFRQCPGTGPAGDDGLAAGHLSGWVRCGFADDGLTANRPSTTLACADDGLAAGGYTAGGPPPGCYADDGLAAMMPTERFSCHHYADDGLTAAPRTLHHGCADDGLTASGVTATIVCYADDGLAAGGYTTSFCPVMGPERAATA